MQIGTALCVAHAVVTGAPVVCTAAPSTADTIHLNWTAPSGCPGRQEIRTDIRRILGASPRTEERLTATGTVWRDAEGEWRAELTTEMGGMAGSRTLRGADCATVTHAAALVLALMLKPGDTFREPASPPPRRTTPTRTETQLPSSAPAAPSGPWLARGSVLTGIGTLPGLEAGYGMHLGAAFAHWAAELRSALWLPKTAHSSDVPGAGAEFWLVELGPAACLRVGETWLRFDTCAGAKLLQMRGESFGVSNPGSATGRWAAAFLEQAAAAALTRHSGVRLALELVWPPSRPAFAIHQVGEIHRPARLAGRAGLAFEVSF